MTRKVLSACGIVGVSLSLLSPSLVGCGKEKAPPAQQAPPAAGTSQSAPAAAPTQDAAQLQLGMTSEQVLQIMGTPGKTEQEGIELEWKFYTPQGEVEVKLKNNLVTAVKRK